MYASLLCARQVIPGIKARGAGAIIFVGATASRRGGVQAAAFAPAKAAQRSLAASMARKLWPEGVHVALIVIDGVVDLPGTRDPRPASLMMHLSTPPASPRSHFNCAASNDVLGASRSRPDPMLRNGDGVFSIGIDQRPPSPAASFVRETSSER